jgi:hypothetical protein
VQKGKTKMKAVKAWALVRDNGAMVEAVITLRRKYAREWQLAYDDETISRIARVLITEVTR